MLFNIFANVPHDSRNSGNNWDNMDNGGKRDIPEGVGWMDPKGVLGGPTPEAIVYLPARGPDSTPPIDSGGLKPNTGETNRPN